MADRLGRRVVAVHKDRAQVAVDDVYAAPTMLVRVRDLADPDYEDPATLGALLGRVREAHHTYQSTEYVGDADPEHPWRWGAFRGATEADALLAAWRAAP